MSPRRESMKHGPRLDDELKRETSALEHGGHAEPRADEGREKEGAADEERRPDLDPTGLPRDPVLARRELSRHLRLGVVPAGRAELLAEAGENDAPEPVLALLRTLPHDARFGTVYEIWDALHREMEPGAHEVVAAREHDGL